MLKLQNIVSPNSDISNIYFGKIEYAKFDLDNNNFHKFIKTRLNEI